MKFYKEGLEEVQLMSYRIKVIRYQKRRGSGHGARALPPSIGNWKILRNSELARKFLICLAFGTLSFRSFKFHSYIVESNHAVCVTNWTALLISRIH